MPPSLASRLLFHAGPPPQLLATKDLPPELTPELYDFIALALRAFVSPWWSKITRYDKDFLPHVTHILTVVIRALELRIQAVDLPSVVFLDLPVIVTQHYRDYRNAAAKTSTAYASGGAASLPTLFAHLQPHMAISPEGKLDPEYYRQIIDHILKVCLPPEDYEPESERIIIREVVVKILLQDIIPKISQPWFIHKILLDALGPPDEPIFISQPAALPSSQPFSFHTLIVVILSALQAFSGMCLALIQTYKQAMTTIKLVQQTPPRTPQPPPVAFPPSAIPPDVFPAQHTTSTSSGKSSISSEPRPSSTLSGTNPQPIPAPPSTHPPPPTHFNYTHPPLHLLSEILTLPTRLSSSLLLTTLLILTSALPSFLDKLLPHILSASLSPSFILTTTRTAKRTLFPNGYPGPPPPVPSSEEQAEMRARLVAWRARGPLGMVMPFVLGPDQSRTLGEAIEPLGEERCNRHLVVFVIDRIVMALFPELGGEGPNGSA